MQIEHADQTATLVEVGAGLRQYLVGGQPVLDGYADDAMADGGRGQPLLPWPNRIRNGRYEFAGQHLQLPLNEVDLGNAIHGLTRWTSWTVSQRGADKVTFSLVLHPQPGYPFTLALTIAYTLSDAGLSVRTAARNIGASALPFGSGQHPYLSVGTHLVDDMQLRVPARQVLEMDDRQIPTGRLTDVAGSDRDFRVSRPIGTLKLDACYTDQERDPDGLMRVVVRAPGRSTITLWMDRSYGYVMVFTGDTLSVARRRRGLAVEPMTCPPNAFVSGTALRVLKPGEACASSWGIVCAPPTG